MKFSVACDADAHSVTGILADCTGATDQYSSGSSKAGCE